MEDTVIVVYLVVYLLFGAVFGFLCSYIAGTKNRDKVGFFFLGFFFGIIGIIVAAAVPKLVAASLDTNSVKPITANTTNTAIGTIRKPENRYGNLYEFKHSPKLLSSPFSPVVSEERSILGKKLESYKYSYGAITHDGSFIIVDKVPVLTIPLKDIVKTEQEVDELDNIYLTITALDGEKNETRIVFDYKNDEFPEESIERDLQALDASINPPEEPLEESSTEEPLEDASKEGLLQEDCTKKCPFCAEIIKAEAIKCRYCASMLEA